MTETLKKEMKGRKMTLEELKEEGWKELTRVNLVTTLFGKGNRRIPWNTETCVVGLEYSASEFS